MLGLVLGWAIRPICLRLGYAEPNVSLTLDRGCWSSWPRSIGATAYVTRRTVRATASTSPTTQAVNRLVARQGVRPGRCPGSRWLPRLRGRPARRRRPRGRRRLLALAAGGARIAGRDGRRAAARARVSRPEGATSRPLRCEPWPSWQPPALPSVVGNAVSGSPSRSACSRWPPPSSWSRLPTQSVAVARARLGHGARPGLGRPADRCGPRCSSRAVRTPPTGPRPRRLPQPVQRARRRARRVHHRDDRAPGRGAPRPARARGPGRAARDACPARRDQAGRRVRGAGRGPLPRGVPRAGPGAAVQDDDAVVDLVAWDEQTAQKGRKGRSLKQA